MTTLEEKVNAIIENSEYNTLPIEERRKIKKFCREQSILILWQVINADKDLTTAMWRRKTTKWLESLIRIYNKEEVKGIRWDETNETEN